MMHTELPLPAFYDPKSAERWGYHPDQQAVFAAAHDFQKAHGIKPSGSDRENVHLLLIDVQKDFCFPDGTLYVAGRSGRGAIDDASAQQQPGDQHRRDAAPQQQRREHQAVPEAQPGQGNRLEHRIVQPSAARAEAAEGDQHRAEATETGRSALPGRGKCGQA